MCGFAAIFSYHPDAGPVQMTELQAINDDMAKRGPDGEGLWFSSDQRIGLAHRRLAIIDLSADAAQPMTITGRDGTPAQYHITYNGEIYNFRALRDELSSQGVVFTTQSDTEVMLRLYERDGAAMVSRLRGMFALALWDTKKQGLLLARDPFGIKPLYYSDDGRCLRVASQVKALLAGGKIDKSPDAAGHVGFHLLGNVPEPHTLYRHISALPGGHTMWVEAGGKRQLSAYFDAAKILASSESVAVVDLAEALRSSVRAHLVADVPVGVFLSSGLDSATLTALASEQAPAGLDTITLGFEEFAGTPSDEVTLAEQIAGHYGTRQHTERVSQNDFEAALPQILSDMDQPTIDGVNTWFVSRAAKRAGLKVAISGLGGDEIFGGYDSFQQIPKLVSMLGWAGRLPLLGKATRVVTAPFIKHMTSPKYAGLLELGPTWGGAWLLRRGLYMPWELPGVMDADMVREGWRDLAPILRLNQLQKNITQPFRKISAMEIHWYMQNQLLRDSDWAGMAHSLEIRTPLVDSNLFQTLAPALGRSSALSKQAMARTPTKALPGSVLNRQKTGFFVPVEQWMKQSGGGKGQRGLRGWAGQVYSEVAG